MTITDSAVRTYTAGDAVPEELRVPMGQWCEAPVGGGYVCSLRTGHTGPQHLAWHSGGREILAAADRDTSGDPVEGTWKPGDVVYRPTYPQIAVGQVLYVATDDDGTIRAWMVAREPGDPTWRLIKADVASLTPYDTATGSNTAPTIAQMGEALATKAQVLDADVKRNREARESAQRELTELREKFEEHKHTVARVARQKAREHDWCSVVDQALREMGLEDYGDQTYRVTVTLRAERTVTVRVTAPSGDEAWRKVDNMSGYELADAYEEEHGSSLDSDVMDGGDWELQSQDASTSAELIEN